MSEKIVSEQNLQDNFDKRLLATCRQLGKHSAGVVLIHHLRQELNLPDFNEKLREFIKRTIADEINGKNEIPYLVSLGQPMGAHQDLFTYKGKYYLTIIIKKRGRTVRVSEQELQKLRKEAKTKQWSMRSCWNCNPAHEALKQANYVLCCMWCGGYFYKGVEITE